MLRRTFPESINTRVTALWLRYSVLSAIAAGSTLCTSPGLNAQVVTQPVKVTASPPSDSITVPDADEARRRIERTPGGVDLVPATEFRDSRATTVKDVLDYVPGVFAQPKYGQEDARLAIRGSGLSRNFHLRGTRVLRDGVPLNDADGAGDTQEVDPLAVDYIEVFKGGNALQYGAMALGGAVNLVSPTGRSQPGFLLRQELGSFQSSRTQLGTGGVIGAFDYYLTPTYSHSAGFRDHTDQDYARFNGNAGYRLGDGAETRLYLSAANINQKIANSVTRAEALAQPKTAYGANFTNNTKRNIDSLRVANKTTFLTETGEISVGIFGGRKELFHPVMFNRFFGRVIDTDETAGGGFARWTNEMQLAGHRTELTLGANYHGGVNHSRIFVNAGGSRGALATDADQTSRNLDLYGESTFYVIPEVALIVGLQGSIATREQENKFGTTSFDRGYNSVSPKLGTRWDFAPNAQAFANFNWSSEPPPFSELGSVTGIEPQDAKTLEVGVRGQLSDIAWDAAIYRAWLHNELQFVQTVAGPTNVNIDHTLHQGIELGGQWTFSRNLATANDRTTLRLAYTFSDFRFDSDRTYGDNDIPGAPRHYIRTDLRYTHPDGWYVGPNIEWVPTGYFVDNANTTRTTSYGLLGAQAGYSFGSGIKVFIDARNLFDKAYISNTGVTTSVANNADLFNAGDGRAVYVGLELKW